MSQDTTTSTVSGAAAKARCGADFARGHDETVVRYYTPRPRHARHPADPSYVEPPDDSEEDED